MLTNVKLDLECENAIEINQENLFKILDDNCVTTYGKKHHFSEIQTVSEYFNQVPLSSYQDFEDDIRQMWEGKENLLTAYPLNGFCISSGTEGKAKYIPITQEALKCYSDYLECYKNQVFPKSEQGKRLFINVFRTDVDQGQEKGLLCSEICYRWLYEHGELDPGRFAGGKELLFDGKPGNGLYAKAWAGILTEDIVVLESAFLYDILQFFGYLEEHWEEIIQDMKNGNIPDGIQLSEKIRKRLLSFKRDTERIRFAEQEFSKGFDGIAKRLWSKLRLVSGISNRAFFAEDMSLKKYTGDTPQHYLCYCASECYIGTPADVNSFDYVLLPKNAFYEFLPYDEGDGDSTEETVLPHECEPGKLYEIVITNFSGLYRYRMGDVLHIKGFWKENPVFEFAFRKNQALNIAGEKMSIVQMEEAIRRMEANSVQLEMYSFGVSLKRMPARYIALFVLKAKADVMRMADILDAAFSDVNRDYLDLRNMGYLEKPAVYLADRDGYEKVMDSFREKHRHNKPLHILPQDIAEEVLERASYETI